MIDFKNINIRLLLLNLIILGAAFLTNDPLGMFESDYSTSAPVLKEKSSSSFSEVKIINSSNADSKVDLLYKKDDQWYVKSGDIEYQADNKRINRSLEDLMQLRKYYEVTGSSEKYKEFEVSDNDFQINLKGNHEYTIIIGKQGASYNSSIIRLKGEKKVYSVKGNLRNDWNQSLDYFRNKMLLRVAKENISQVDIKGSSKYTLVNNQNQWSIATAEGSEAVNTPRVERLISDLTSIEGVSFFNGENPGRPYGIISVHLKSNIAFDIDIRKSAKEYYIKSNYNPYWQTVSEYRVKSIYPEISEIIAARNTRDNK